MDNDVQVIGPFAIEKIGSHFRVTQDGMERYRSKYASACSAFARRHTPVTITLMWGEWQDLMAIVGRGMLPTEVRDVEPAYDAITHTLITTP